MRAMLRPHRYAAASGRWWRTGAVRLKSMDAYGVLGVSKSASQADIKSAYRKLAKKWHPDLNQDDRAQAEKKFKEVSEAYQLISDPQKRQQYDMFGGAGQGNPFAGMGGAGGHPNVDPFDMFKQAFGGEDVSKIFQDLEQAVRSGKVKGAAPGGGPGAFYNLDLSDILKGGPGGAGFASGFPGAGAGFPGFAGAGFPGGGFPGSSQTIQQVVMKPDGSRVMRTTTITYDKDGKPQQSVSEHALPS